MRPSLERRFCFVWMLVTGFVGLGVAAGACGPVESPCTDVECERGVCEEGTGECRNPEQCTPDGDSCLAGYSCVEGACEADQPCGSGDPCPRGICKKGACVNAETCEEATESTDCVEGYGCEDGNCVVAPCSGKNCERGVCDPATGKCVDRESCPSEVGEKPACIRGHKCYEPKNTCYGPEAFCEAGLQCDRGVCSFAKLECVDADTCSSDTDCLEGDFCTEEGECRPNVCDEEMEDCQRGTCDPATGTCVNPTSCQSYQECLPDHWCVDGSCLPRDEACGESGCPGNRICTLDGESGEVTCGENPDEPCTDARDCVGARVCNAGSCEEPTTCSGDPFESNDSESAASSFHDVAEGGAVSANVCSGDVDVYAFDTSEASKSQGTLAAQLKYVPTDVGLGTLELEVVGPDGSTVGTATTGGDEPGSAGVRTEIGSDGAGTYFVKVRGDAGVEKSGIRYDLSVGVHDEGVVDACTDVPALEPGSTEASTLSGTLPLESGCTSGGTTIPEKVYELDIARDSWVSVEVEAASGVDLAASLRRQCADTESEMVCANRRKEGGVEAIQRTLVPGTYYLVVQGVRRNAGGDFTVTYDRDPASCTGADNSCVDGQTAEVCEGEGDQLVEQSCEFGCDSERGVCQRAATDACSSAGMATGGLDGEPVEYGRLEHDFDGAQFECLSDKASTGGADAVYRATVGAGEVLSATLSGDGTVDKSLYLLDGCQGRNVSCLRGVDSPTGDESLTYYNTESNQKTVYLVADAAAGRTAEGQLDVEIAERICRPGTETCGGSDLEVCNDTGTERSVEQTCKFGCASGGCIGDRCEEAKDAGGGGSWTLNTGTFDADYELGTFNDCIGDSTEGSDVVYRVDVPSQHWLQASVTDQTGSDTNPAIYISKKCGTAALQSSTCLAGANTNDDGTEYVEYLNRSSSTQTYYVVVNEAEFFAQDATWQVDIDVRAKQCTPGTPKGCADSQTLEYCDRRGVSRTTYACQGSPASCEGSGGTARCADPQGDVCADAIPVASGDSLSGTFGGTDDTTLAAGDSGACEIGSSTVGPDTVYQIELSSDDLLTVGLSSSVPEARMYLLGTCYRESSCRAFRGGSRDLQYFADQSETVYVVVDAVSSVSSGSFTVDFDVRSNATCEPGTTSCPSSGTVGFCNDTGTGYAPTYACESGTCNSGACEANTRLANGCSRAPSIGNGSVVREKFGDFTDVYSSPGCASTSSGGPDAFYKLDVDADDLVEVSLDALGAAQPVLYLFESCSNVGSSCLAGSTSSSAGGRAEIRKKFDQAKTIFVGVDSKQSASGEFELAVKTEQPVCTPDASRCRSGTNALEFCPYPGSEWVDYTCADGCSSGVCGTPTGESCVDPIPVAGNGSNVTADLSTHSSKFDLSRSGCTNDETPGNDVVYTVEANAGETISVDATPLSNDVDPAVLLARNCSELEVTDSSGCVAGADNDLSGDTENLSYSVPSGQGGTYYAVIDADDRSEDDGEVDVSIDVR